MVRAGNVSGRRMRYRAPGWTLSHSMRPGDRGKVRVTTSEPLKGFHGPPSFYLISWVSPSSPPQPDWTETLSQDPTYFPISLLGLRPEA